MPNQTSRECSRCHKMLPPTTEYFYSKGKNNLHAWCKKCLNKNRTEQGQKRKLEAIKIKGGKCLICGYNRHPNSLDFHHLNPDAKEFGFTNLRLKSWIKYKKELDKCILVCGNCHGEIHAGLHPQYLIVKDL